MRLFEIEGPQSDSNVADTLYLTLRNFSSQGKLKIPYQALSKPGLNLDYYTFDKIFKSNKLKFKTVVNNYNEAGVVLNNGVKPSNLENEPAPTF